MMVILSRGRVKIGHAEVKAGKECGSTLLLEWMKQDSGIHKNRKSDTFCGYFFIITSKCLARDMAVYRAAG